MNGAKKGAQFERDISRKLSLWVSSGRRDDLFWRSAGSGSMATNKRKTGKTGYLQQHGDITAIDDEGKFFTDRYSLECKALADLQLDRALWLGTGNLMAAIDQCFTDAVKSERAAMLILKQNRKEPIVGLTDNGLFILDMLCNGKQRLDDPRMAILAPVPGESYPTLVKFLLLDDLVENTSFDAWHQLEEKPEATWHGV